MSLQFESVSLNLAFKFDQVLVQLFLVLVSSFLKRRQLLLNNGALNFPDSWIALLSILLSHFELVIDVTIHLNKSIISLIIKSLDLLAVVRELDQDSWLPCSQSSFKRIQFAIHILQLILKLAYKLSLYDDSNLLNMVRQLLLVFYPLLDLLLKFSL